MLEFVRLVSSALRSLSRSAAEGAAHNASEAIEQAHYARRQLERALRVLTTPDPAEVKRAGWNGEHCVDCCAEVHVNERGEVEV